MKRQKKKNSVILRVLILCVSVYLLYSLTGLWKELVVSSKQLDEYNSQIEAVSREIGEYKELLAEGNELKIIEKAARERLGFVYADEQVFVDVSGN